MTTSARGASKTAGERYRVPSGTLTPTLYFQIRADSVSDALARTLGPSAASGPPLPAMPPGSRLTPTSASCGTERQGDIRRIVSLRG
jgi:hypothetical protein